jgi:dolichyl-phosphate-mannose-protein mannosyltransferase
LPNRAFSVSWWAWLVFTGVMIASAVSVKFVGLFVVILVGMHTAADLWDVLGDLSKPIVSNI